MESASKLDPRVLSTSGIDIDDRFLGGVSTTRMDKGSGSDRLEDVWLGGGSEEGYLQARPKASRLLTNVGPVRRSLGESSMRSSAQCTHHPAN